MSCRSCLVRGVLEGAYGWDAYSRRRATHLSCHWKICRSFYHCVMLCLLSSLQDDLLATIVETIVLTVNSIKAWVILSAAELSLQANVRGSFLAGGVLEGGDDRHAYNRSRATHRSCCWKIRRSFCCCRLPCQLFSLQDDLLANRVSTVASTMAWATLPAAGLSLQSNFCCFCLVEGVPDGMYDRHA